LAGQADLPIPSDGPMTVAIADVDPGGDRVMGIARDVPWPDAGPVVLAARSADATFVSVLAPGSTTSTHNLGGEPRGDVSFDLSMPVPIARAARGVLQTSAVPSSWQISALNDQHGYLRWSEADAALAPVVGERVGFGISHPCTTFDKYHWMPIVENDYRVIDAAVMHF
jgi:D-serine deaminase-like pyridoxal phosphate-dependent protein